MLGRAFYQRPAEDVARNLLAKIIVRESDEGTVRLRIVETEAYLGVEDPACHTFGGRRTERVGSMWGEKGHAYVYLIYGLHHCLNAVCGRKAEDAAAVLLRAAVLIDGHALVRRRRSKCRDERRLLDGPGKLCQALAVDRGFDSMDLCDPELSLRIESDQFEIPEEAVEVGPRVGIASAGEAARWQLRFFLSESVRL